MLCMSHTVSLCMPLKAEVFPHDGEPSQHDCSCAGSVSLLDHHSWLAYVLDAVATQAALLNSHGDYVSALVSDVQGRCRCCR